MIKSLELAVEAMSRLSEADQERMGQQLLSYVEKLVELRVEIDKGVRSLDMGGGRPLDVEYVLRHLNQRHD